MDKSSFDDLIKNKLNDLPQLSRIEGAWDLFKPKLDNHVANRSQSEELFDGLIKTKVSNHLFTHNSTAWGRFLDYKFNHIDKYRKIVRIKIMELVAVMLLLLTIVQWVEDALVRTARSEYISPEIIAEAQPKILYNVDEQIASQVSSGIDPDKEMSTPVLLFEKTTPTVSGELISSELLPEIYVMPLERRNFNLKPSSQIISFGANSLEKDGGRGLQELSENNPRIISLEKEEIGLYNFDVKFSALPTLTPQPLYSEFPLILPMDLDTEDKRQRWAVSGYFSSDFNLINTPFDKIYSLTSYQREFINSSYGLGLSRKTGAVEYQVDVAYAKRDYEPRKFRESFGANETHYYEKSLDKISFDIMSSSLSTKYHFINKKSWSSYLTTIASINLIMKAEYDITRIVVLGRPAAERYIPETPRLDQKPFNNGVIHDRSLAENYFVTAGVGFGIEKSLTDKVFLFLESSHQRHLFSADIGIGPNKDRIHTSSMKLGFRTWLN